MEREIKFRAWDKRARQMVNSGIQFNNTTMKLEVIPDLALMQFTGLLDRNSKEIYEGDIVRDNHGTSRIEYVISNYTGSYFCNTYAGNPETGPNANGTWEMCYFSLANKMEIIGNIFENPELLPKE